MKYLAITRSLAEWLLPKVGLISSLHGSLESLGKDGGVLREMDFQQNAIRISLDVKTGICAMWHTDYVSGTGAEDWGFIRWSGEQSLCAADGIGREVLE